MDAKDSMIRGVWFEKEYKRYYPLGTLACDVVGFTSSDNVGRRDILLGLVALRIHPHAADQGVRVAGVVEIINQARLPETRSTSAKAF